MSSRHRFRDAQNGLKSNEPGDVMSIKARSASFFGAQFVEINCNHKVPVRSECDSLPV
jgi:hypothetical protein